MGEVVCGGKPGFRLEPRFPVQLPEQEAAKEACTGLPAPLLDLLGLDGGGGGEKRQEEDSP